MAEGFLKKYLDPKEGFMVFSAGLSAIDGMPPTRTAVEAMREEGIDISFYLTKSFSQALARSADIILVMTSSHKEGVLKKAPYAEGRVFLYNEFAGIGNGVSDIDDPIGQPLDVYRAVRDNIKKATKKVAERVRGGICG
jgi:protein-tyrosine phosphatase